MEITKEDLMFVLDIGSTLLDQLLRKQIIPIARQDEGRGKRIFFDLRDSVTAFRNWQASAGKADLTTAKTRRENALATLAEMDLAERQGETVRIPDVVKEVETEYHNVKAKLLSIPSKISGQILGMTAQPEIAEKIDEAIRIALVELSEGKDLAKRSIRKKASNETIESTEETEAN